MWLFSGRSRSAVPSLERIDDGLMLLHCVIAAHVVVHHQPESLDVPFDGAVGLEQGLIVDGLNDAPVEVFVRLPVTATRGL